MIHLLANVKQKTIAPLMAGAATGRLGQVRCKMMKSQMSANRTS